MTPELEELLTKLKGSRRQISTSCVRPQDIAKNLLNLQQLLEQTIEQLTVELTSIINNGGGGATSPVYVIRAVVNQLGGVLADQPTFAFDGETTLFTATGSDPVFTAPEDRTARNTTGRFLQDNEVVRLVTFNGTLWLADKISENAIRARVIGNVTTDDATFNFDEATAIGTGGTPAGGTGVAINLPRNAYANDELLVLELVENPDLKVEYGLDPNLQVWTVLQDDDDLGGGGGDAEQLVIKGTAGAIERDDPTFVLSQVEVVQGGIDPGTPPITNDPPIKVLTGAGSNRTVFAAFDKASNVWRTGHGSNWQHIARGNQDYKIDQVQVMGHLSNQSPDINQMAWLDTLICNPAP